MCSPSAPDMTAMNTAAASQAALSKEQLDWAKQIYAETAPDRKAAADRAAAVSDSALKAMDTNTALAQDYADYQKGTFRPLETGIVTAAENYDTPDRREAKANQAMAGIEQQIAASQEAQIRNLSRRGVNPSSGATLAMGNQTALAGAVAKAGAAQAARDAVETQGYARKMDAANLGRNLSSNQATSAGIALNAGNSATSNQNAALGATTSGTGIMQNGFSGASNSMASSGNIYGNIAGVEQKANDSQGALMGGVGSALGGAFAAGKLFGYSDVTKKEDITPTDPDQSLEAVEQTPVSNWAYKEGVLPGESGQKHTGPMAQDVQKNMGSKTAPKGKKIDLVSMNGILMSAVQGLSQKVDRIAAAAGIPA